MLTMYKFMKSHGDCHINFVKIVAAFPGMHVSPAKHSFGSVTDGQTDGQTDDGQSDPYVSLCFAGDTKTCEMWYVSLTQIENVNSTQESISCWLVSPTV